LAVFSAFRGLLDFIFHPKMENERAYSPEIPIRHPRNFIPVQTLPADQGKSEEARDRVLHSKFNLLAHSRGISSLKFQPQGKILCSAGADAFIFLWNHKDGRQVRQLLGHKLGVDEVAWSHDGRYIASASDDSTVKIWDVEAGRCVRTMKEHAAAAFSCGWNIQVSNASSIRP
jgi:WD40 repeat protein